MEWTITLTNRMANSRKFYGLSCVDMGRICGFGINQWRRYEDGKDEPKQSSIRIISIVTTPIGMMNYLNLTPTAIKEEMGKRYSKVYDKVMFTINEMNKSADAYLNDLSENYFDKSADDTKDWDGQCRCGHKHSEHHPSSSHNYSAGYCTIGECRCKHFINNPK